MIHEIERAKSLNGLDAEKKGILKIIIKILIESGLLRRAFEYISELLTKDEEETDGEIAPEVMEEFKQAINKYVDYKPGRGLPMRDDIKISRFGSDDDTDYSTF